MTNVHSRIIVVCDHASSGENGKVNLVGIFKSISAPATPTVAPPFFLASQIETDDESELNSTLALRCRITDPKKVVMTELKGEGKLGGRDPKYPGALPVFNFFVNVNAMPLPHFGYYVFEVIVNEQTVGTTTLLVEPIPAG